MPVLSSCSPAPSHLFPSVSSFLSSSPLSYSLISPSPSLCLRQACHLGSLTRAGTSGGRQEEGVLGHSEEPSDPLWGEPHIPQGQKETCYKRCGPETASVPSHLQTLKDKTVLAGNVGDARSQGGSCSARRADSGGDSVHQGPGRTPGLAPLWNVVIPREGRGPKEETQPGASGSQRAPEPPEKATRSATPSASGVVWKLGCCVELGACELRELRSRRPPWEALCRCAAWGV